MVRGVPLIGEFCYQAMHSIKAGIKDALSPQVMFTDLGLKYVGPIDGHDARGGAALRQARRYNAPVMVHVMPAHGATRLRRTTSASGRPRRSPQAGSPCPCG